MNKPDFSQPQRKNVLAIIVSLVFSVQGIVQGFLPLLFIFIFKKEDMSLSNFLIGGGIVLVLLAIHSYFSWKNFYFYIKNDEFIVERGYLKKNIIALPLDKIVSVHTNQKLLHQLLGVVEVEVDSTGTDKKEVKIEAVKKDFAVALEEALTVANVENVAEEQAEAQPQKKVIIAHSFWHIFKIGVARNHIQGLILVALFVNQFLHDFRDVFKEEVDSVLTETTTTLENSDTLLWTVLIVFVILFSVVFSLIRTFLFYYDLKLVQMKKTFLLQLGLLKRKKMTVPFSRIQAIAYSTNPLQRLLKITTTQLIQASGKILDKDKEKVLILGCTDEQKNSIQKTILGQIEKPITLTPHWAIRNKIFMTRFLVFAVPFLLPAYFESPYWLVGFAVMTVLVAILSHFLYKNTVYSIDKDLLCVESGYIVRSKTLAETYKMQTVVLSQTFFQKRRNTATLRLHFAGIKLKLAYIPLSEAVALKDFFLHKTIENRKDWL